MDLGLQAKVAAITGAGQRIRCRQYPGQCRLCWASEERPADSALAGVLRPRDA